MARINILAATLAMVALALAESAVGAPKPTRVLFVGNSLTYYNALPSLVERLAASSTPATRIEYEMLAAPGASVRQNIEQGHLEQVLSQTHFDVVVFQEIGGWPLCPDEHPECSGSARALEQAARLIKKSGARPILLGTYQAEVGQAELTVATRATARHLDVAWIDWGAALQRVRAQDSSIELLIPNNFHPLPAGSWLAALELARIITSAQMPPHAPPAVCAPDWTHAKPSISNATLASKQSPPAVKCFEVADSTYQALRAAALAD